VARNHQGGLTTRAGQQSDWFCAGKGVPRESILGPLLLQWLHRLMLLLLLRKK